MLNKEKAREVVDIFTEATKHHTVVNIVDNGERLTRFSNSEIHQNVEIDDTVVNLTLHDGKKSATSQSNAFDKDSLLRLVQETEEILENSPEGEQEFIPTPLQKVPELTGGSDLEKEFDIKGRAAVLKRCFATLDKDYTAAGAISLDKKMHVYGDCTGNFHYMNYDTLSFSSVVTHKDGATGYGAVTANRLSACDIDTAFKTAYEKAKASIDPVFADLGAYTVVLESEAVANLLLFMLFGLNGDRYQKGMSFASDKLGQKLFGKNLTVRDDVTDRGTFQRFFDSEGYTRKPVTLVENGVVKNVLHCSKTAQKAGEVPTGHSFNNLGFMMGSGGGYPLNVVMQGGDSSLEEMIGSTKKGILVTHFHYCNTVNPRALQVTGLTRDGTFMIENGKVTTPIKNMRFTESLLDAFSNITELSKDLKLVDVYGYPSLIPAAKIENFHFTSGQK